MKLDFGFGVFYFGWGVGRRREGYDTLGTNVGFGLFGAKISSLFCGFLMGMASRVLFLCFYPGLWFGLLGFLLRMFLTYIIWEVLPFVNFFL